METTVTERPLLCAGPVVRATLDDLKTMTRRPLKGSVYSGVAKFYFGRHPYAPSAMRGTPAEGMSLGPERDVWCAEDWCGNTVGVLGDCPYGVPGDRLWVRETFVYRHKYDRYYYRADHPQFDPYAHDGWKPSIHMPRRACRLTLEVTGVRVEPLQAITEADAVAEGVERSPGGLWRDYLGSLSWHLTARDSFRSLWESLYGPGSWDANPWVWAITFKRLRTDAGLPGGEVARG